MGFDVAVIGGASHLGLLPTIIISSRGVNNTIGLSLTWATQD
jgi:hypothetical protein